VIREEMGIGLDRFARYQRDILCEGSGQRRSGLEFVCYCLQLNSWDYYHQEWMSEDEDH